MTMIIDSESVFFGDATGNGEFNALNSVGFTIMEDLDALFMALCGKIGSSTRRAGLPGSGE